LKRHSTRPHTRTKLAVKLPDIKFSHITPPTYTRSGCVVDKLPNQPEIVRTGGTYFDENFYIVLDLEPLRSTGFEDIVGQHLNDHIYISKSLFSKQAVFRVVRYMCGANAPIVFCSVSIHI